MNKDDRLEYGCHQDTIHSISCQPREYAELLRSWIGPLVFSRSRQGFRRPPRKSQIGINLMHGHSSATTLTSKLSFSAGEPYWKYIRIIITSCILRCPLTNLILPSRPSTRIMTYPLSSTTCCKCKDEWWWEESDITNNRLGFGFGAHHLAGYDSDMYMYLPSGCCGLHLGSYSLSNYDLIHFKLYLQWTVFSSCGTLRCKKIRHLFRLRDIPYRMAFSMI